MDARPNSDKGYFHLTADGWIRQDHEPFPANRVETWLYEMECPAEDAKDRVYLTRVWVDAGTASSQRDSTRARYPQPMTATPYRNVTLECLV